MTNIVIGIIIAIMLSSTATAYAASGFNILKDNNVAIKLSYPTEVEIGSCFKISVDVSAFNVIENLTVILKLTYIADSTTTKIFDKKLLDNINVDEPGILYSKTISVCVPTAAKPDPYLKAEVYAIYDIDDEFKISDTFYMMTIRTPTYSQLLKLLDDYKKDVKELELKISELEKQIENLENELVSANNLNLVLSTKLSMLDKNYNEIKKKYDELLKKHDELNNVYIALVQDYGSLKGRFESLRINYETLQKEHQEIRRDYELISKELNVLQSIYNDLKSRHSDLQVNYEGSLKMIGELRALAEERERNLNTLQVMLSQATSEGSIVKSLAVAQSVGLAGVGAYLLYRRRIERKPATVKRDSEKTDDSGKEVAKIMDEKQSNLKVVEDKDLKPLKILSGRRITIPMNIAEELGLKVGDLVRIYKNGETLIIKPEKISNEPNNGQQVPGPS